MCEWSLKQINNEINRSYGWKGFVGTNFYENQSIYQ